MSPFLKGALVAVAAYWALQHFTGVGKTGAPSPFGG